MKKSRLFIDTNLWVYAFLKSDKEISKQKLVLELLENILHNQIIIISVQILNEFHWVLKRKYRVDESQIRNKINNGILAIAHAVSLDLDCYQNAYEIRDSYEISYWDSIVVATALKNKCEFLYSEDMQYNLIVRNQLTIVNPFVSE